VSRLLEGIWIYVWVALHGVLEAFGVGLVLLAGKWDMIPWEMSKTLACREICTILNYLQIRSMSYVKVYQSLLLFPFSSHWVKSTMPSFSFTHSLHFRNNSMIYIDLESHLIEEVHSLSQVSTIGTQGRNYLQV